MGFRDFRGSRFKVVLVLIESHVRVPWLVSASAAR